MSIATIPQQCLVFVQNVLGIHSNLAPTAASATGEFQAAGFRRVAGPGGAAIGDIVQFQPGQFGVGSAGHVGVITSLTPNGAQLAQANWGPGSNSGAGTVPSFLNVTNEQLASLAIFHGGAYAPGYAQAAASDLQNAGAQVFALKGAGGAAPPGAASNPLTAQLAGITAGSGTGSDTGAGGACQPLAAILTQSGGSAFLGGLPLVGGLYTAATYPEKLVQWAIQPCVRWRLALGLGALVLVGLGLSVTFRKQVVAVAQTVGKDAEGAA